jgi:pimeloyl-ACP methyl ester carboxylesterase
MQTFILVPGGWCGAWAFEAVTPLLELHGHTVHAMTLTGLRPGDAPLDAASANLDTHADDVLRLINQAGISGATLVGHSYGGMVITAAADRAIRSVERLVYLDAYVPIDGQSCWAATTERYREIFAAGAASTGYLVRPPDGLDSRAVPHPLASFVQAIRLSGAVTRSLRREFVFCSRWNGTPFRATHTRLQAEREWKVRELPTGHDVMREAPDSVAAILCSD